MTFNVALDNTDESIAQTSVTLLVQLMVDNSPGLLTPRNYTEVHSPLPANSRSILVPASALVFRQEGLLMTDIGKLIEHLSETSPRHSTERFVIALLPRDSACISYRSI